jgi:hypothetical protein
MPVFSSMPPFRKYNPFLQPPLVASQIGHRSYKRARFVTIFWRAFLVESSHPCVNHGVNHNHQEVSLVVLYTMVYLISWSHGRLVDSPTFLPLLRWGPPWLAIFFFSLSSPMSCPTLLPAPPVPSPSHVPLHGQRHLYATLMPRRLLVSPGLPLVAICRTSPISPLVLRHQAEPHDYPWPLVTPPILPPYAWIVTPWMAQLSQGRRRRTCSQSKYFSKWQIRPWFSNVHNFFVLIPILAVLCSHDRRDEYYYLVHVS